MWTKFTGFDIQRVSVQRVPECKVVDPKESEEENEEENQEREKEGKIVWDFSASVNGMSFKAKMKLAVEVSINCSVESRLLN